MAVRDEEGTVAGNHGRDTGAGARSSPPSVSPLSPSLSSDEEDAPPLLLHQPPSGLPPLSSPRSPSASASSSSRAGSVPVTIVSGLLGAGKTTLLRALLSGVIPHTLRILAIQNEFSIQGGVEAPLRVALQKTPPPPSGSPPRTPPSTDGPPALGGDEAVGGADDADGLLPETVYQLPNGCICCSIKDELIKTLEALLAKYPDTFDYIVVEASGVATPQQLVEAFWLDEPLQDRMHLDGLVTLVDPTNLPQRLLQFRQGSQENAPTETRSPPGDSRGGAPPASSLSPTAPPSLAPPSSFFRDLWIKQIVCADKLVITKRDVASASQMEETLDALRILNPLASRTCVSLRDAAGAERSPQIGVSEILHLKAYERGSASRQMRLTQRSCVGEGEDDSTQAQARDGGRNGDTREGTRGSRRRCDWRTREASDSGDHGLRLRGTETQDQGRQAQAKEEGDASSRPGGEGGREHGTANAWGISSHYISLYSSLPKTRRSENAHTPQADHADRRVAVDTPLGSTYKLFSVRRLERLLSSLLWSDEGGQSQSAVPSALSSFFPSTVLAPQETVVYRCKALFVAWLDEEDKDEEEPRQERGDLGRDAARKRRGGDAAPWGVFELQGVGRVFEISPVRDGKCLASLVANRAAKDADEKARHVEEGADGSRTKGEPACAHSPCCRGSHTHTCPAASPEAAGGGSGHEDELETTRENKDAEDAHTVVNRFLFVGTGLSSAMLRAMLQEEGLEARQIS
ncbi:CobW/P47K family protein [Besnoitia besnoiti]|uniref:CobW/P47K family protein n=1 Tax=Besnoitia besnoiti TaxID=94643 RepID=A0A2A9MP67_BESBE|nr:CobW/P47K family protein [Besnoitia besnoiti]PFH38431.1 CobW/P47K family protein [Besnoitia besnoiti]